MMRWRVALRLDTLKVDSYWPLRGQTALQRNCVGLVGANLFARRFIGSRRTNASPTSWLLQFAEFYPVWAVSRFYALKAICGIG